MGAEFFNDAPKNLYIDKEAWENIQKWIDLLMKFNIYVDAIVKNFNGWLVLHDTTMNIEST